MPARQSEVIRFLNQPEAYPHQPVGVEQIQTHISHVFIASPYVYKLKRARNLGFLDFTTLEQRIHFCRQEVVLNRRLCKGIYLGLVGIYRTDDGDYEVREFSSEPVQEPALVEVVVRMRELSHTRLLINYARHGWLKQEHLEKVADHLEPFYRKQSNVAIDHQEVRRWGDPEVVLGNAEENFRQTESFIGRTVDRSCFESVRRYSEQFVERFRPLLNRRVEEGRIVEGHGDLHLEHIYLNRDQVCIYDCIEFTERFRCLDIASDVAFLAMDLDFHGLPKLGRQFLDTMSRRLEDPDLKVVADFYCCYRAWVRGKVRSFATEEASVGETGRDEAAEEASAYFNLSLKYALFGSAPVLLVMMGRVASGKSFLARQLAGRFGFRHLSSDRIRKTLAGLPAEELTPSVEKATLYSEEMSGRTYRRMRDLAREALAEGESVILDATFGDRRNRELIMALAEDHGENLIFVEATASVPVRRNRLLVRDNLESVTSDARAGDMEMLDQRFEPPEELPADRLIHIDAGVAVDRTLEELFRSLVERHLEKLAVSYDL